MRVRRTLLPLVLCAGLVGCSAGDGKPTVLPSLGSGPSPSVSPQPEPTGIHAPTPQGAVDFARYFYKQIERAFDVKDPEIVDMLSAPECRTCQTYIGSISALRDKNQRLEGHLVFTISLAEAPAIAGSTARVDVIWSTPALRRFDATGALILDQKPLKGFAETVHLRRGRGSWLVTELES